MLLDSFFLVVVKPAADTVLAVFPGAGLDLFLLFAHTLDPKLLHVLVPADLRLRELAFEDDADAHQGDGGGKDQYGCEDGFHGVALEDEFGADRLVIVNLADDGREGLCHRDDLYLACVSILAERNRVGDEYFLEFGSVDPVVGRA